MSKKHEVYISIDVETSGPIPGEYSMLTIGACNVDKPDQVFSCKLKPISTNADPEALAVTGLSLEAFEREGLHPEVAMTQFQSWVGEVVGTENLPVFVGLNAPFDWSFVNYYFHRYLQTNPFGFTALDIKALYMGATGSRWVNTRSSQIAARLQPKLQPDHQALHDAQYQAELFRLIRAIIKRPEN